MSQVVQDLIAARAVIARPENWCKNVIACTTMVGCRHLFSCGANHPDAEAFCVRGAIMRATGSREWGWGFADGREYAADDVLNRILGGGNSAAVLFNNDVNTTHPQILDLFDRAIALAIKEAAPVEAAGPGPGCSIRRELEPV